MRIDRRYRGRRRRSPWPLIFLILVILVPSVHFLATRTRFFENPFNPLQPTPTPTRSAVTSRSGPIRTALGMNATHNVLANASRANATIGRSIRLMLLNVLGGIPGQLDRSTLGRNLLLLRRRGLAQFADGEDLRAWSIRLTPKARKLLEQAIPLWEGAQAKVERTLGKDGVASLLALLERVEQVA